MRFIARMLAVTAIAASSGFVGSAAPASAATLLCSTPSWSSSGHTAYGYCQSGPGSTYQLVARFCNQGHCTNQGSGFVPYGVNVQVSSGGYYANYFKYQAG